ncbi:MAG: hypothetical protein GY788_07390 [bacterium]|nr:hypothetical protein [bacterium]
MMNKPITADRREKHIEMHEAIQNMDGLTRHLDELIERMEGPVPQIRAEACEQESTPHFMDVLNGAPDAIREKTDSAHKQIQRLTDLLF